MRCYVIPCFERNINCGICGIVSLQGYTPLIMATKGKMINIVELLLDYEVDSNMKDQV